MLDLERTDPNPQRSTFASAFGRTAGVVAALIVVPILACLGLPLVTLALDAMLRLLKS